ncbi:MAG: hypothetical protein EOS80_15715 [Mesorhizobium sp.]|nr:MAG: hypothetical protein EOS80_15715 [Mesorhizobium sp.]
MPWFPSLLCLSSFQVSHTVHPPAAPGRVQDFLSTIFCGAGNCVQQGQRADDMVVACRGNKRALALTLPISPLVGEMPGRAEGGAVPPT